MEFTVKKFSLMTFVEVNVKNKKEKKEKRKIQTYSFKDKYNNTIIIAYGEKRRDMLIKQLSK